MSVIFSIHIMDELSIKGIFHLQISNFFNDQIDEFDIFELVSNDWFDFLYITFELPHYESIRSFHLLIDQFIELSVI